MSPSIVIILCKFIQIAMFYIHNEKKDAFTAIV